MFTRSRKPSLVGVVCAAASAAAASLLVAAPAQAAGLGLRSLWSNSHADAFETVPGVIIGEVDSTLEDASDLTGRRLLCGKKCVSDQPTHEYPMIHSESCGQRWLALAPASVLHRTWFVNHHRLVCILAWSGS